VRQSVFGVPAGRHPVFSIGLAMATGKSSTFVIYAALVGNLLIAITKFAAAGWTGSSAILSEAVHSLVDTSNQVLMLYGIHRAKQPPDEQHPLGYGRELYFWSFIVALLIFSLGAGLSFYEGVTHIQNPIPITDPTVNYVVLAISLVFEGTTCWIAFRAFEKQRGKLPFIEAATRSRDPPSFLVLFEDAAAILGIFIAFAGIVAAESLDLPQLDGVASIGIAAVLAATAIFLARECKGLLIGEPARTQTLQSIRAIAQSLPGVDGLGRLITAHLAPEQIVAILEIDFADRLSAPEVQKLTHKLEQLVKQSHPDVIGFFANPKSEVGPGRADALTEP
jgi:cation diffusion facilitator family transporter